jgi:hypothetical protein
MPNRQQIRITSATASTSLAAAALSASAAPAPPVTKGEKKKGNEYRFSPLLYTFPPFIGKPFFLFFFFSEQSPQAKSRAADELHAHGLLGGNQSLLNIISYYHGLIKNQIKITRKEDTDASERSSPFRCKTLISV